LINLFALVLTGIAISTAAFVVIWILLEKRQPTSSLAWIGVIIALPYLGIALYFVFGRRRMRRRALKKEKLRKQCLAHFRSYAAQSAEREVQLHQAFKDAEAMLSLAINEAELPLTVGNRVTLLKDHDESYPAIFNAIAKAKHSVNVLFYIIKQDSTGEHLGELLMERARAGVKVRLIFDDFGSIGLTRRWKRQLREAGVEIAVFLPLLVPFAWARMRWSFRNHRKIVIVDDAIGFTGGLNIGEEYEGKNPKIGRWRDCFIKIEGPAAATLNYVFWEDWHYLTNELLEPTDVVQGAGDMLVHILPSGPDRERENMLIAFFVAISSAKRYCYITTPYFIPHISIKMAMMSAAMRGVDICLLLPGRSDHKIMSYASRSYYEELLDAGVRIFEYGDGFLHSKTICVDDSFATVGSANMDPRSLSTNFEVNAFVYDKVFAEEVKAMFYEDLLQSREITAVDELRQSMGKRLLVAFARLFSPIL
jgi:cardiolipin synthase